MCAGAVSLYGIKRVVMGENSTFVGERLIPIHSYIHHPIRQAVKTSCEIEVLR
jgi:hypothetical protein